MDSAANFALAFPRYSLYVYKLVDNNTSEHIGSFYVQAKYRHMLNPHVAIFPLVQEKEEGQEKCDGGEGD